MPKISRRAALRTALVAVAATSLLAGCAGQASSADTVNYWGAFSSADIQKQFVKDFVDPFNASSDDAQVKLEVKQWSNIGSLTDTAVAAGRGPDVVFSPGPSSALGFASAKRIESLDSYAKEYDWEKVLQPWAYQASLVDGKLYSIPTGYGSIVMFYNPAVFAEHGWTVPTTAAEFEKVATEASAAGMIPVGAGNSGYQAQSEWYLSAVLNAAVGPEKLYDVLTGKAKFTDPEFVDAMTTLKSQIDKGWWGGSANSYFTNTDTDMFTGLASGKVALYMTGTWSFSSAGAFFGEAAGNDAEWDWAPLPALSDNVEPGVFPLAIGTSLSINEVSKNKPAAAKFLDSLINDPSKILNYMAVTNENPAPVVVQDSDFPSNMDERIARLYKDIPKSSNLGYASWTFFPAATDTYLYTEFDKIITGDLTPADYLAGLQKTFDGEFAAGKVIVPFAPTVG